MVRPENDFRIFAAFENVFVHFLVASIIATISAGCVNDDFAAGLSCRRIRLETPFLERECSVDSVNGTPKRPLPLGLRATDPETNFIGGRPQRRAPRRPRAPF